MDLEHFEEMLPAYLDGDLSDADRAELQSALESSAQLRESLLQHRALEETLLARRDEVPAVDRFLGWMDAAAPVQAAVATHNRLRRFMDTFFGVPSLAVMACAVVAMWSYWNAETIAAVFGGVAQSASKFENVGQDVSVALNQATGGDATLVIAAYVLVTLGIMATTGVMTMRFVRGR